MQVDTVSLTEKLHPDRFPNMSDNMAAVVGFFMNKEYTTPSIESLLITSDGLCLARAAGDIGHNDLIGTRDELESNWRGLVGMGLLSEEEEVYCLRLLQTRLEYC